MCVRPPNSAPTMIAANMTGISAIAYMAEPGCSRRSRLRPSRSVLMGSLAVSRPNIAYMAVSWGSLARRAPSIRSSTRCWQTGKLI